MPRVLSVNISSGGIPKLPVNRIKVTAAGLEGDGHDHQKHYRPEQAVSLQDIEKLEELTEEGYPLMSGTTGENITFKGLSVNDLPIGTQLAFSGGLKIELTKVRKPCYVLDSIDPKLKEDIIERCGMYAKVITEGELSVNEEVEVVAKR